jgi:acyl-CoA synthetase (AMP-forming)/AMP-acid ligase II
VAADCGAEVVLGASKQLRALERIAAGPPELAVVTPDDCPPAPWNGDREVGVRSDSLALIQYTSGSTGEPRGVALTHANLLANQRAIRDAFDVRPDEVALSWLPLYHDMGLIGAVFQSLHSGATTYLMSPLTFGQWPARWLRAISELGVTVSGGPNFAFQQCVDRVRDDELATLDLSAWDFAYCGAEPVRPRTLEAFCQRFAPAGFRPESLLICYGLAEATLLVAGRRRRSGLRTFAADRRSLEAGRARPGEDGDAVDLVSVGVPPPEHEVRIIDPVTLTECEPGEIGEIWVRGPSVASGYWRRVEESARTFRATLSGGRTSYLRTGDVGFVDGGELFVTGRLKDLIVVRGRNIHPHDIEDAASASDRAVGAHGAAFALGATADGTDRVVLVQELRRHYDGELGEIASRIRSGVLASTGVTIDRVVLVRSRRVPLTSSGKVRRRECRRQLLGGELDPLVDVEGPTSDAGAGR